MRHFLARFTSLASHRTRERQVLINFACLRNACVADAVLGMMQAHGVAIPWWAYLLGPCYGVVAALISADFIEHYGRWLVLGYFYNPNVSAIGELEGSMCPTDAEAEPAWRRTMFTRLAPGDDPGSGHYDFPIAGFWNRVRALWRDA